MKKKKKPQRQRESKGRGYRKSLLIFTPQRGQKEKKYNTGWSMRADGSSLDCAKTLEKLEPALVDLDPFSEGLFLKSEPDKIRFWFNKFLGLFLKEVCAQGCYRPLPPLLADGQPVDLFKLFLVVSENDGYNAVSKSGLWDLVAKESGFDLNVASSLKLVYVKY